MNKELLTEFYSLDSEFVATYHGMKDMTIDACANDTWETIKDAKSYVHDFGYFTIDDSLDFIPRLTGFFIKPEYRNKETYMLFYKEVCKETPNYWMSCAHEDNTKVVNFLNKLGGKPLNINKDNMVYFLFKQGGI